MSKSTPNEPIVRDITYQKSNVLISAKYQSSLTENKIMAMALSDQTRMVSDAGGTIRVKIPANEIRAALGGNGGSFYQLLKDTAKTMNNRQIGIINDENGQFAFYQIVQTCSYVDGELQITFNSDLSKHLKSLSESFTLLNLPVMMSFKSEYSFRLYEILRSRAYNRSKTDQNNEWHIDFELAELMLQLGIVNSQDEKVQKILNNETYPDYQKAVEVKPEDEKNVKKSLLEWGNFKKYVLNKAVKEINEKTELEIDYDTVRGGLGGKIKALTFTVRKNILGKDDTEDNQTAKLSEDDVLDYIEELIVDVKLKTSERKAIAKAADYDIARIRKAYQVLQATNDVDNPAGFLVKAIKENWEAASAKSGSKANSFANFEQNTYDYGELEKRLVAN